MMKQESEKIRLIYQENRKKSEQPKHNEQSISVQTLELLKENTKILIYPAKSGKL